MKQLSAIQLSKLQSDLKGFGLNPDQWRILREKNSLYRVQSKRDKSFYFQGTVGSQMNKPQWQELKLISI